MTQAEQWILGCTIVMALGTIGALIVSIVAVNKRQEVKVEQPVSITITEELHKIFASKETFDEHVRATAAEFRTLRQENKHDRELIAVTASKQVDGVYKRIEDVRKELSEKMDDMPDRVIATLTNTGAIGGRK